MVNLTEGSEINKQQVVQELLTQVFVIATKKFIADGGNMREVLRGDMQTKLSK